MSDGEAANRERHKDQHEQEECIAEQCEADMAGERVPRSVPSDEHIEGNVEEHANATKFVVVVVVVVVVVFCIPLQRPNF